MSLPALSPDVDFTEVNAPWRSQSAAAAGPLVAAATAPQRSQTTAATGEAAPALTVVRKVGRPTRFSPQLAESICALVQGEGMSDTQAGRLLGIPKATLSRWKAEDEEFAFLLEHARAFFQREHVQRVLNARRPDGSLDWRASAWLLQRMFPEQYGSASARRVDAEDACTGRHEGVRKEVFGSGSSETLADGEVSKSGSATAGAGAFDSAAVEREGMLFEKGFGSRSSEMVASSEGASGAGSATAGATAFASATGKRGGVSGQRSGSGSSEMVRSQVAKTSATKSRLLKVDPALEGSAQLLPGSHPETPSTRRALFGAGKTVG